MCNWGILDIRCQIGFIVLYDDINEFLFNWYIRIQLGLNLGTIAHLDLLKQKLEVDVPG
ncbi:hypothetical protein D3C84_1204240 [compost metagenome]